LFASVPSAITTTALSSIGPETVVPARIAVVLLACLLAYSGGAAAEPPHAQLQEVVVTATRTRTQVDDTTTSVSVISGADVEERDQAGVADALRGAPGLDVTQFGGPGSSAFASIRGAAPDQVLVLLDGVEVNDPSVGQFDFANLTSDNLDRIEVLRGGGGALYGSEAIGGVVNVISRRGEGPLRFSLSGEGGRAATNREVVGVTGAHGPFALSGTASFNGSDGFRSINSDYRNFSTNWRGDADLVPGGTLRGFVRYTDARTGLVDFNIAEQRLDPDAYSHTDFFLGKGEWEHVLGNLTYRAAASFVRNNQRFRDNSIDDEGEVEPEVVAHFPSEIITGETQVDYRWREFALSTVGVEYTERSVKVFEQIGEPDENEPDEPGENAHHNANRSNVAAYAQEQLRFLNDTLHAVGGVRYDHYDNFGDQVTWSGSGSYLVQPSDTRLRLSYAEGFRVPTFAELFDPALGNSDLQAETSWEIDAGLTQDFLGGRLRFEPTYFYREVSNFIEEISDQLPGPIAGVPEAERARNVNARFQGVELIASAQPLHGLSLWANYTYLNFVTATGTLLNRPRHRGAVGASAERPEMLTAGDRASAALQIYAVGHRDSADPFSQPEPFMPGEIGSYARVDLALSYRLPPRWAPLTLTATVRNLLNRDYSESLGFPAPPAWFLIGLRYALSPDVSLQNP
jgi:vitamin B12 transporter